MFAYIPYELNFLQSLLAYRPEVLDPFFIFLNHLDKGPAYSLIAILFLTFLNPKLGMRCFTLIALCVMTNFALKNLFMQPRPLILDPSLGLIETESLYGLPSGAAEASTALAVFLMHYYKQPWVKFLAVSYVVLICVSRVYIGMHFISDVLAGVIIGFLLAKLFVNNIEAFEEKLATIKFYWLWGAIGLSVVMVSFLPSIKAYQAGAGFILGALFVQSWFKGSLEVSPSFARRFFAFGISALSLKLVMILRESYPFPIVIYAFLLVNMAAISTYLILKRPSSRMSSVI